MASINKAIIVGNVGRDPEIRYTTNGSAVANFTVATNERWTNKNSGQLEERTEWHRVVAYGKLGEFCKEYLTKGKQVYIEGKLRTRQWEDKEGNTRWTTEISAQTLQLLGRSQPGEDVSASIPVESSSSTAGDDSEVPF